MACPVLLGQTPAFSGNQLERDHHLLPGRFTLLELDHFMPDSTGNSVFLENGFASTALRATGDWHELQGVHAVRITLVYSRYPSNWGPGAADHDRLLAQRLMAIFAMDSTLNSDEIDWVIVLQSGATSEQQARALPHGIEITYSRASDAVPKAAAGTREPFSELQLKRFEKQVLSFIKATGPAEDATMENVIGRDANWSSALMILDWTRTMQRQSAEAILWHIRHLSTSRVRHIVLFTDGERGRAGHIGDQGGIYYVDALDLKKLTRTMRMARSKARNPDPEEGDLEAILRGTQHFGDVDRVTLVADNSSCIRDYCLLDRIRVPVHIVLCGTRNQVNPVYVNLAHRTHGSVHLEDQDLCFDREHGTPSDIVLHGTHLRYKDRNQRYVPTGVKSFWGGRKCDRYYDLDCTLELFEE